MSQRITKVLGLIALTGTTVMMDAQTFNWKPAGPIYNAGRARNMVVDKNDSKTLYVGSASSGIFKSKNGGVKWYAINDQSTIRNISYLAQAADGTIYAGTGEGFLRAGQKNKAQSGTGLYKLNPSDSSLVQVVSHSIVGTVINRVACSQTGANIALATNMGIFVSINGGAFTQVTLPGAPTGSTISGQDVKFDSNGILYCAIGTELATSTTSTVNPSKIYKSDASLSSFTNITPPQGVLLDANYGRIELAIAPSDNNVIYASCANKYVTVSSATLKGLFVSYDAGATWALITQGSAQLDPLSAFGIIASGDYAQALMVSPTNPHQIFFGSYLFYSWTRTNNSNSNPIGDWIALASINNPNSQSYIHPNIHDIKFVQGSPSLFYFITDAGIYRSSDLAPMMGNLLNNSMTSFPSYQPFYKGLVTGQFNSVSIERYPIGEGVGSTTPGSTVKPYVGFIGGTGGNGLTYFSGTDTTVSTELNYIGGEVYNTEYSKILPNAAIASVGTGVLYRSTNIKNSPPAVIKLNKYNNELSKIAPVSEDFFAGSGITNGTPFRMWENYGQIQNSPDSAVFYNDTTNALASMSGLADLTTRTTFTFQASRPNQYALIDSIVVRTGTVVLPMDGTYQNLQTPFTLSDSKIMYAALPANYAPTGTLTTMTVTPVGQSTLPVTFTLNSNELRDYFSVSFPTPPFMTKTVTSYPAGATGTNIIIADPASYYRVFATIFYKYKAGDVVGVTDEGISTKINSYSTVLTKPMSWRGSPFPSYTVASTAVAASSTSTLSVSNPTYVLIPNASLSSTVMQSSPVFTVSPYTTTTYTLQQYGDYVVSAPVVVHKIKADVVTYTITATPNPTVNPLVYILSPGNYTQSSNVFTVAPTSTAITTYTVKSGNVTETFTFEPTFFSITPAADSLQTNSVFYVSPTVTTSYTVTQTTGTMTPVDTYSTIGTSTYVLEPGTITHVGGPPTFTITVPVGTNITYTVTGISADPLSGPNTIRLYPFPLSNVVTVNFGTVPFSKNNIPVKMRTYMSARLAMIVNNPGNSESKDAIIVSKNPLALNDPLSVVRVTQASAQTPVYTDDATGNATTNTIIVVGKPTLLEWSKNGTEIYFATNANRVYRVSHINEIMDLSKSSYSGKFYTDIYKYTNPLSSATLNTVSPYRTTLLGTFDRPVTSISVSKDDQNIAVTFNTTGTGTTGIVMYNTNSAKTSNESNINWSNKQNGTWPSSVTVTYCSLMEKDNSKNFYVGTDNGMYYTSDISAASPTWVKANNNQLPNVQIFDIKQQTFAPWDAYNSGQIYIATNGRGVWTSGSYVPYTVGIEEHETPVVVGKNLNLYPNPTNGNVNVAFTGLEGETAMLHVMDISGRVVQTEALGKLNAGEVTYNFATNGLNSGVYIVNISSDSGVKRVTKLIVTK